MSRPDAILVPKSREHGSDASARMESILDVAEPLLECGPHELAWCRDQTTYFFCTRSPEDSELYPTWHPESGKPRYDWVPAPHGGIKLGHLR